MKKVTVGVWVWFFVLILANSAGALPFSGPCVDCDKTYYTDYQSLNTWMTDGSSKTYSHTMPATFGVPPDEVDWATLTIAGWAIGGNDYAVSSNSFDLNDNTYEETTISLGTLTSGRWYTLGWSWSSFDLMTTFKTWDEGSALNITINANENDSFSKFYLGSSKMNLCYTDNDSLTNPASVSEPGNMILMGTCLVGLAGASRRKILKKKK